MLLYEMPRAVLRGACLQYTIFPAVCYAFCSYLSENSSLMPLGGAAVAGRGKGRCGAAKPWPRSGRPPRGRAAKCRARFCAATPKGGAGNRPRGFEAMDAKRTTAQGGFAQRNAAPDFARQTQKVGPMTGQPGFAAGEMRPNGSKGRGESGSRV